MEHYISPSKTALTFAFLIGGLHLVWSILIAFGWAQALVDFIFWAHMATLPLVIKAFDATTALTLIVITSIVGYALGYISAIIWNRIHRS